MSSAMLRLHQGGRGVACVLEISLPSHPASAALTTLTCPGCRQIVKQIDLWGTHSNRLLTRSLLASPWPGLL
jgi:hypothetical protein